MLDIKEILNKKLLSAVFQPIINLHEPSIIGFEGLIRGPVDCHLHKPSMLFDHARQFNLIEDIELLAMQVVLSEFAKLQFEGKLFLNVSLDILLQSDIKKNETLNFVNSIGLQPSQVVIEITENIPTYDYQHLKDAAKFYQALGFEIAIDDLGEGFSGLRLWSELRPNYVKVDKHFIQNIHIDSIKLQFVKSIQEIAQKSDSFIIAEGVETFLELEVVRNLGIAFGQGYYISKPQAKPLYSVQKNIQEILTRKSVARDSLLQNRATVEKLLKYVTPVDVSCANEEVFKMFEQESNLYSIPVIDKGVPVGIISRYSMIDGFARPFRRELYGRRSCSMMMDSSAIIVDKSITLQDLNKLVLDSEPHHLSLGFIITDNNQYIGLGSGQDLLRLVTYMQLNAARYANPLTLLPGNVPICEQMDYLLNLGVSFVACYCDLDNFKAFNDVYGYQRGDDVIQATAKLLASVISKNDFIGHVGGDDFIVLFTTEDWEIRCNMLLVKFDSIIKGFYDETDKLRGGLETEDRQGKRHFHSIIGLSIGAVLVENNTFHTHHEISSAISIAKKQAKRIEGSSLFLERRHLN